MASRINSRFNITELLVVVGVLAVLIGILFPVLNKGKEKARQTTCISNMAQLGKAMFMYANDYDGRFCPMIMTDYDHWYDDSSSARVSDRKLPGGRFLTSARSGLDHYYTWMDYIYKYVDDLRVYSCPSQPIPHFPGYGYSAGINGFARDMFGGSAIGILPLDMGEIKKPSEVLLLLDFNTSTSLYPYPQGNFDMYDRSIAVHNNGVNVAYTDGHCKWLKWELLMGFAPNSSCPTPWNPFDN